jgi:Tol biopolymer transport system component
MVQDYPVGTPRQLHHFGHATESKAHPALTADGRLAVVVSSPPNTFGTLRLYLVDIEADTRRMLFATMSGSYHFWPIWLPGDSGVAFLGGGGFCGNQVLTARLDGSNLSQRTATLQCSPPFFDVTPEAHLVLLLERHFVPGEGNNADIYEITMAGDTVGRLTNTTTYEGWPAVSPDGSQIAYTRGEEVWIMNRDGSAPRPLLPAPSSVWGHSPTWTKDSRYIVLQLYADIYIDQNSNGEDYYYKASQIYAVRVADGLAIRLTHTATGEVQPDIK